jgi:hypothetical protein
MSDKDVSHIFPVEISASQLRENAVSASAVYKQMFIPIAYCEASIEYF